MASKLKATIIDHLNLDVRDFKETFEFYNKVFGFELLADQPERNCQIVGNEHVKLCFYQVFDLELGQGLNHLGFHISNYDEIIEVCKTLGVPVLYEGTEKVWEKSKSLYIEDPNGYEIELSLIEGGGLWQIL